MRFFSFNSKQVLAVLTSAVLLLSVSSCEEKENFLGSNEGTDTSSGTVQSNDSSMPQTSRDPAEAGEIEKGFPVSYIIDPPWHYLRDGKLVCTFHGARLTFSTEGLESGGFRDDASVFCGGESLSYPEFIAEDGEHFVPGVYLLLVDVTVRSEGAESFTRRDLDNLGHSRGEFDDPYLFRSDDLVCLVDLGPKLASAGLPGSGCNDMDYFNGMNRRGEHPVVFRLEPGESIDLTIGFLVSDVEQGGDNELDWLYLAEGAVHDPKDALIHLDLSGEEVLRG